MVRVRDGDEVPLALGEGEVSEGLLLALSGDLPGQREVALREEQFDARIVAAERPHPRFQGSRPTRIFEPLYPQPRAEREAGLHVRSVVSEYGVARRERGGEDLLGPADALRNQEGGVLAVEVEERVRTSAARECHKLQRFQQQRRPRRLQKKTPSA